MFMSGHSRGALGLRPLPEDDPTLIQKPFTEQDLLVKVKAVLTARSLATS
jgi:hypothetical protein